jgi:hypothetical protein
LLAILMVVLGGGVAVAYWAVKVSEQEKDKPSVEAPKGFVSYRVPDGSFRCEFPSDWKHHLAGETGRYEVTFSRGRSSVHIIQGPVESLVGDIAAAPEGGEGGGGRSPVAVAHEQKRDAVPAGLTDYQEEEAEPTDSRFGRGLRSPFTATANDKYRMRGYRATLRSAGRVYEVVCQCPETDWENLEPAFAHVIESVGPDD